MKTLLATLAAIIGLTACGGSQPSVAQRCHNWGVIEAKHYPLVTTAKDMTEICVANPKVLKQKP